MTKTTCSTQKQISLWGSHAHGGGRADRPKQFQGTFFKKNEENLGNSAKMAGKVPRIIGMARGRSAREMQARRELHASMHGAVLTRDAAILRPPRPQQQDRAYPS